MQRFIVMPICLLLAAGSAARCAEPYVTATYQPSSGGFLLQFMLHNSLSEEALTAFSIHTGDAVNPASPAGWNATVNYREVYWDALLPASHVQPGAEQGGFSYVAQNMPGELGWFIGGNSWGYGGRVTPTAVPEPSSLLALGGSLAAIGLPWLKRRVRLSA